MKFVSALLIAMIAMILVLPALGMNCAAANETCGFQACCGDDGGRCVNEVNGSMMTKMCRTRSYKPSNMSQVRKSLLSALSILDDH